MQLPPDDGALSDPVFGGEVLAHGLEARQEGADLVPRAADAAIKLLDDLDRPPQADLEQVDVDDAAVLKG